MLFMTPITSQTWVFIAVSMFGGFLYTAAKLSESKSLARKSSLPSLDTAATNNRS